MMDLLDMPVQSDRLNASSAGRHLYHRAIADPDWNPTTEPMAVSIKGSKVALCLATCGHPFAPVEFPAIWVAMSPRHHWTDVHDAKATLEKVLDTAGTPSYWRAYLTPSLIVYQKAATALELRLARDSAPVSHAPLPAWPPLVVLAESHATPASGRPCEAPRESWPCGKCETCLARAVHMDPETCPVCSEAF